MRGGRRQVAALVQDRAPTPSAYLHRPRESFPPVPHRAMGVDLEMVDEPPFFWPGGGSFSAASPSTARRSSALPGFVFRRAGRRSTGAAPAAAAAAPTSRPRRARRDRLRGVGRRRCRPGPAVRPRARTSKSAFRPGPRGAAAKRRDAGGSRSTSGVTPAARTPRRGGCGLARGGRCRRPSSRRPARRRGNRRASPRSAAAVAERVRRVRLLPIVATPG